MPTAAAATLVMSATGAAVATSGSGNEITVSSSDLSLAKSQAADAQAQEAQLATRQQQAAVQAAMMQGRQQESVRAARDSERKALAAKAAAEKAAAEGKRWVLPAAEGSYTLTSGFGWRWGRMHEGEDFACPIGTPLLAMSRGTITYAGEMSGFGTLVKLKTWDGTEIYYGHLSKTLARVGDTVMPGDRIALSGNTGHSTGPHLHLEIHPDAGKAVDPMSWLSAHGLTP